MIPSNLYDSVVINDVAAAAADIGWASNSYGELTLAGLGTPIKLSAVTAYKQKAFAAGTPQVTTLDFTGHTFTIGVAKTIVIMRNDTGEKKSYSIMPVATAVPGNATLFQDKVNNDPTRWVNANDSTDDVIFTQLVDTGGFTFIQFPSGTTSNTGTPYVASSGTQAEVAEYNPLASGQFDGFFFNMDIKQSNSGNTNTGTRNVLIVAWLEKNDTHFAAFLTAWNKVIKASDITDAIVEPYARVIA